MAKEKPKQKPRPKNPEAVRPYHFWLPQIGKTAPGRCYCSGVRAANRAWAFMKYEQPGTVMEIVDVRTGNLLQVWKRHPHHVECPPLAEKPKREEV